MKVIKGINKGIKGIEKESATGEEKTFIQNEIIRLKKRSPEEVKEAEEAFAYYGQGVFDSARENSKEKKKGKKAGADKTNKKKKTVASDRQYKINEHLTKNPNPDKKSMSLEGYLIKVLELKDSKGKELTQRTVKNDLKKINLEKR